MPESRDRMTRPVDNIVQGFLLRHSGGNAHGHQTNRNLLESPLFHGAGSMGMQRWLAPLGAPGRGVGRTTLGTRRARNGRGGNLHRAPVETENRPLGGDPREGSLFPAFFPRTPLADVTAFLCSISNFWVRPR